VEKTTELAPRKKAWRWGTNRWIVLALLILGYIGATYFFSPVRPFVQLPAEHWMEHPLFTTPFLGIGDLIKPVVNKGHSEEEPHSGEDN